jgi:2,4-diaminopentanoate dehydrogenase
MSAIRVAQWGTGHTGMSALRSIIEHPQMELVACRVYAEEKVGRDAGELCGAGTVGVTCVDALEAVLAAEPDCVVYMPLLDHESIDDLCAILESGIDVVTTITTLHHAPSIEARTRARIEAACTAGGSSIYDSGSCPGFITEVVPLALVTMERRLSRFAIEQFADLRTRRSPEFLGQFFGLDPADADLTDGAQRTERTDGASLRQVADSLGVPIDHMTATSQVAVATRDEEIAVMTIPKGTVAAWRQHIVGTHRDLVAFEYSRTMYVSKHLDPDWNVLDTGWRVHVEGDVPMVMDLRFLTDDYGSWSPGINANLPVNSIPAVVAAPPGIVSTAGLGITPLFGG